MYVPSSNSDLYKFSFKPDKSANCYQPFPGLFAKEHFNEFDPNTEDVAQGLFMNHTRQQLKDVVFDDCGYAVKIPEETKDKVNSKGQNPQQQGQNPQQQGRNPQQQNQTMAQVNNKR